MRTLIIGGTGLISTGITRQLVDRGEDVTFYEMILGAWQRLGISMAEELAIGGDL